MRLFIKSDRMGMPQDDLPTFWRQLQRSLMETRCALQESFHVQVHGPQDCFDPRALELPDTLYNSLQVRLWWTIGEKAVTRLARR